MTMMIVIVCAMIPAGNRAVQEIVTMIPVHVTILNLNLGLKAVHLVDQPADAKKNRYIPDNKAQVLCLRFLYGNDTLKSDILHRCGG